MEELGSERIDMTKLLLAGIEYPNSTSDLFCYIFFGTSVSGLYQSGTIITLCDNFYVKWGKTVRVIFKEQLIVTDTS